MEPRLSKAVNDVIALSRKESLKYATGFIASEHLVLALLIEIEVKKIADLVFKKLNLDTAKLSAILIDKIKKYGNGSKLKRSIPLTLEAERVLKISFTEADSFGSEVVTTLHLLLAVFKENKSNACIEVRDFNITYDTIKQVINELILEETKELEPFIRQEPSRPLLYKLKGFLLRGSN